MRIGLAGKQRRDKSKFIKIPLIRYPAEALIKCGAPERSRPPVDVTDCAPQIANGREIYHPPRKLLKHTANDFVKQPPCSRPAPPPRHPPLPTRPPSTVDVHEFRPTCMMRVRCAGAVQPWSLSPQHVLLNVVKCDSELESLPMNMCNRSPAAPCVIECVRNNVDFSLNCLIM